MLLAKNVTLLIMDLPNWPAEILMPFFEFLGKFSGSLVIDPNNILIVLIPILEKCWPTKSLMPFLSSSDNFL